jgi:iron only hydrogenase large subunit-like protein
MTKVFCCVQYYTVPFHAYDKGNLSLEAALEVELAARAVHATIFDVEVRLSESCAGSQPLRTCCITCCPVHLIKQTHSGSASVEQIEAKRTSLLIVIMSAEGAALAACEATFLCSISSFYRGQLASPQKMSLFSRPFRLGASVLDHTAFADTLRAHLCGEQSVVYRFTM